MIGLGAAEHIADDVGAMQPRRHVAAIADRTEHESEMLHAVVRRDIGVAGQRPAEVFDRKGRHALDQLFARLAVRDEIGDRNHRQLVLVARIG